MPVRITEFETGDLPSGTSVPEQLPRIENLVTWQGRVTKEFVDHVINTVETYLQ